jgi:PKD repeat protein
MKTIVAWDWDWGDGSPHAYTETAEHTYTLPGTYVGSLTVEDNEGDIATSYFTTVVANTLSAVSWDWDWGDGSPHAYTETAEHTYTLPGTYVGSLTVEDNEGDIATSYFTTVVANTLSAVSWDLGDETEDTGAEVTHLYASAGVYPVVLTVEDSLGNTATREMSIVVTELNSVVSHSWSWGDGSTPGVGDTLNHIYSTSGIFPITLSVIDNRGETASTQSFITSRLPVDDATFSWDFGNGQISSEINPVVIYDSAGTYTVSLVVTTPDGIETTETKVDYIVVLSSVGLHTIVNGCLVRAIKKTISNGNVYVKDDSTMLFNPGRKVLSFYQESITCYFDPISFDSGIFSMLFSSGTIYVNNSQVVYKYANCVITEMSISWSTNNSIKVSLSFVSPTRTQEDPVAYTEYGDRVSKFDLYLGDINSELTTKILVNTFDLKINNTVDVSHHSEGSDISWVRSTIEGDLTVMKYTDTLCKWRDDEEVLQMSLNMGSYVIRLPSILIRSVEPGALNAKIGFVAGINRLNPYMSSFPIITST